MALYTPKNYPWQATTGYEEVDAFAIPSLPETNRVALPCYVPEGMSTTPLTFPNLVNGFNRNPIYAARTALNTRYESTKWLENHNSLMEELSENLTMSKPIIRNLDNLVREEKNKLKADSGENKNKKNEKIHSMKFLKSKLDELSSTLEKVIEENNELQDYKCKLQSCIGNMEAPLQIAQECLHHRETRYKSELVNDKVERMLMKETEYFRRNQVDLEKELELCEIQLIKGRRIQSELENFLRRLQWIVIVNRSDDEIKRITDSKSYVEEFECLTNKSKHIMKNIRFLKKQIDDTVNDISQGILKIWNETNEAFLEKCTETKKAIDDIESGQKKIKKEIFNVEKNLKYLKTNKGLVHDLQQGQELLVSLLRTKENLESELSSKINSLFIDDKNCMTLRNCYPISISIIH